MVKLRKGGFWRSGYRSTQKVDDSFVVGGQNFLPCLRKGQDRYTLETIELVSHCDLEMALDEDKRNSKRQVLISDNWSAGLPINFRRPRSPLVFQLRGQCHADRRRFDR